MNCRLCSAAIVRSFATAKVLGRNVSYFDCSACSYVQTENPTWLEDAYLSPINASDVGIMVRNQANVNLVLATLSVLKKTNGLVVDCAGGYGILVRLLRDRGVDALWTDPYSENLLARGFEYCENSAALVTAFEAFEHFVDPMEDIEKFFAIAPNLLITTELIATPSPPLDKWWYYGLDHGQHIGFFRYQTLQLIAKKFGKYLVTNGVDTHLFTEKPVSSLLWNLNVRIAKRFPFFYGQKLQSKVLEDFEKISGKT